MRTPQAAAAISADAAAAVVMVRCEPLVMVPLPPPRGARWPPVSILHIGAIGAELKVWSSKASVHGALLNGSDMPCETSHSDVSLPLNWPQTKG